MGEESGVEDLWRSIWDDIENNCKTHIASTQSIEAYPLLQHLRLSLNQHTSKPARTAPTRQPNNKQSTNHNPANSKSPISPSNPHNINTSAPRLTPSIPPNPILSHPIASPHLGLDASIPRLTFPPHLSALGKDFTHGATLAPVAQILNSTQSRPHYCCIFPVVKDMCCC